jgi:hypothetical protein
MSASFRPAERAYSGPRQDVRDAIDQAFDALDHLVSVLAADDAAGTGAGAGVPRVLAEAALRIVWSISSQFDRVRSEPCR